MQMRTLTLTTTLLLLAACGGTGGGGSGAGPAAAGPQSPTDPGAAGGTGTAGSGFVRASVDGAVAAPGAPRMSGTPGTRVAVDEDYLFVPVVSDPDGDPLQFSAAQLPAWAGLDPATGRIAGRPRAGDQGSHGPITLAATDGTHRVALPPFTITVTPPGVGLARRSITLKWRAPERNEDGSLVGRPPTYLIHLGRASRVYDQVVAAQNPGASRHTLTDLEPGTWYMAMTSVNEEGLESRYSAETVAVVN